jgi:hypothetical protein
VSEAELEYHDLVKPPGEEISGRLCFAHLEDSVQVREHVGHPAAEEDPYGQTELGGVATEVQL